jgi:poly [ADP-ribose] polymerase 2/3/4
MTLRRRVMLISLSQLMRVAHILKVRPFFARILGTDSKLAADWRVYIDPNGIIFDVSLNQTNTGDKNNNKFYRIQLLQQKISPTNFVIWTRWGRVGAFGQTAIIGPADFEKSLKSFEKKFKDKTGLQWGDRLGPPRPKKYVFIERSYEPDSEDETPAKAGSSKNVDITSVAVKSKLPFAVEQLMRLIFNAQYFKEVMAEMDYDAQKMPLGKLSKRTLEQGYECLKVSE